MQNPMKRATAFIRKVIENPDAYPDTFIALPRDPALISKVLSRERTKIVDYLESYGPVGSLQALADALRRDKAAVSRDLDVLIEVGLVRSQRRGRRKELRATGRPIIIQ